MHIAVAGNIGAGKTTLTKLLSKHFKWEAHFEDVDDNPYLDDFYHSMERWSFNLQIYFLNSRFRQILDIRKTGKKTIQDRTIYEDAYIFAMNLYQSGVMSDNDYATYRGIFDLMMQTVKAPDLTIYLKADLPKLLSQIQKRGRDFENNISAQYLSDLNAHYEQFINNYTQGKLLVIDVNHLDYVNNHADFEWISLQVEKDLVFDTPA